MVFPHTINSVRALNVNKTKCRFNEGRNRTGPPCIVGRQTAHAPDPAAADRPRARQPPARQPAALQTTTTDDDDRRQRAKQYWPIRRASNNIHV